MARLPRLNIPNIPQHVIQRGNNRTACFFSEQDHTVYLDKLNVYATKYSVRVHAFVLMTNHVHLLCLSGKPRLAQYDIPWQQFFNVMIRLTQLR